MNHYEGAGRNPKEKNDCTVIAISNALVIPYKRAYNYCKKKGRIKNHGFNPNNVFRLPIDSDRVKMNLLGRTFFITRMKIGMTLGRFLQEYGVGRYLIAASNHAFVVIDGKQTNGLYNMNARVKRGYKIEFVREPKPLIEKVKAIEPKQIEHKPMLTT